MMVYQRKLRDLKHCRDVDEEEDARVVRAFADWWRRFGIPIKNKRTIKCWAADRGRRRRQDDNTID